ncbi:MAG: hypothetical protein RL220_1103 [Bacteroidota bacterium]
MPKRKEKDRGILYAVTDIETTGGHASGNAITEIAVYLTDGLEVLDSWHSLINPGTPIPRYIEMLTGITDDMVSDAPDFEDVAEDLLAFLSKGLFVAHNVNFDYSFIRESFRRAGVEWKPGKLCTMRLARKAFPGMRSYGLGNLCRELEIANASAHRAFGDAEATVRLLHMCLDRLPGEELQKFLPAQSAEKWLPAHLQEEEFLGLPEDHGVYFLLDSKGKPLYIGKANNIRKRVRQHFTVDLDSPRQQAFMKDVHHVDHIHTGSELMALLLEDSEIRKHWPSQNRAQKRRPQRYVIMQYFDQSGYLRLAIQKTSQHGGVVKTFYSISSAEKWLSQLVDKFDLNRKLVGLPVAGMDEQLPAKEEHNDRLARALREEDQGGDVVFLLSGRTSEEHGFVRYSRQSILSYGFVPREAQMVHPEHLEPYCNPLMPSETAIAIVNGWMKKGRRGVQILRFHEKGKEFVKDGAGYEGVDIS